MRSKKTRSSFPQISCKNSRNVNQNFVQHSLYSRPSVQKGTVLNRGSNHKCATGKWREIVRPLSHRGREGVWRNYVKKRGSIVIASLEALTCVKESKTVAIDAGIRNYLVEAA